MSLSNQTVSELAGMLASYHMYSFRARRAGLLADSFEVKPLLVSELENVQKRMGNQYGPDEAMMQATGLHEIMTRNRNKIEELRQKAEDSDRAKVYLQEAQDLLKELEGANYLLELLNG